MKTTCLAVLAGIVVSCGFGFANDSGNPIPAADYWGWQCWDGGIPDPDAGCPPPGPCDDMTYPSLTDGGVCLCDDLTTLPGPACAAGPCADGTVPTQIDGGSCVCDDGTALPAVDCGMTGPCNDGTDPSIGDGGCLCDDGTPVPAADCEWVNDGG